MRTFVIKANKSENSVSIVIPLYEINTIADFKGAFPSYKNGNELFTVHLGYYINMCSVITDPALFDLKAIRAFLKEHSASDAASFIYFEDIGEWAFSSSLSCDKLVVIK